MSTSKSRREFLIAAGTGVAVGLLSSRVGRAQGTSGAGGPQLRTRRNVASSAAQSDLDSLRKGVDALKKLAATKPSDPRGWVLQAFIHGDCDRFTFCQHGNWYFAPWHRSYIYYFEQLIQQFSGNPAFALPYWDWSRIHGVPASFYGSGNPLDDGVSIRPKCASAPTAGRGRSVKSKFSTADLNTYVGTTVINRIQQNPDFATYGGSDSGAGELERTPHNFIHRWVGGSKFSNMVQYFSPLDPIFWLHHCNLDRLYSNWLARPGHIPPSESQWRDKSFNDFYDRDGNQVGKEFTCGMTLDSKVMGYVYDQTLAMPQALTERAPAAGRQEVVASVAASKATRNAGVLSFTTDAPPPTPTRLSLNAAAVGAGGYVVRLRIEGVKTPKRQNTGVQVFLGPGVTPDTPVTAPGYVGSFTFFDGQGDGGGHQHEGPRNVLLNATDAFKRLYGDTSLPENTNLSVSFVSRALFEGVAAFAAVEEIQPDRIQIDVVNLNA